MHLQGHNALLVTLVDVAGKLGLLRGLLGFLAVVVREPILVLVEEIDGRIRAHPSLQHTKEQARGSSQLILLLVEEADGLV